MKPIVTLTLNPAIDVACEADEVRHTQKTRTFDEHIEPGGGGINVARGLCGFSAPTRAIYLAGGAPGRVLDGLVADRCIERDAIWVKGDTRISLNVRERNSGHEYRFVPEGAEVSEQEWRQVLDRVAAIDCDYFVASGSLPPGIPDDFYARIAKLFESGETRFMLDTSGAELRSALAAGVFLIKPSLGELEELVAQPLRSREEIAGAGAKIVADGQARLVAVTLGHNGSILVCSAGSYFLPAVDVEMQSAVGAGDSFLAGITFGLATGHDVLAAFRLGAAAGAAAVQAPGSALCRTADVDLLLPKVDEPEQINLPD